MRIVHRILDGFTDDLTIFDEAREKLERVPRRRGAGRRSQHPVDRGRDRPDRSQGNGGGRRQVRDRAAHRDVPGAEFPRVVPAPAMDRHAAGGLPHAGRGKRAVGAEHRDARGSRLERAAQADEGRPQASRRAVAGAAEAPVRGARAHRVAARRARAVHGEPGRGARRVGEAFGRLGDTRHGFGRRAGARRSGTGEGRRRRREGGEGRGARRGNDAGRARAGRRNPRSSTTSSSRSRRIWSAARGSSSKPTTASSRSRSSRGSARCAAPTSSPTGRG